MFARNIQNAKLQNATMQPDTWGMSNIFPTRVLIKKRTYHKMFVSDIGEISLKSKFNF